MGVSLVVVSMIALNTALGDIAVATSAPPAEQFGLRPHDSGISQPSSAQS